MIPPDRTPSALHSPTNSHHSPLICADKAPLNGDERYFIEGWENIELSMGDFATCIKNGWAYCPQLKGKRSTKNFLRSHLVSVDIDYGVTIEDALQHPFVKAHLSMLCSSSSHSTNHHKFRLVFLLPRDVIDAAEQTILNRALARMLGASYRLIRKATGRELSARAAIWCSTGLARSSTSISGIDWILKLDHTEEKACDPRLRLWALGSCRSTIELHPDLALESRTP